MTADANEVPIGPFGVSFSCRDVISFVGAYNGRPAILGLAVRALDGHTYEGLTIEVTLSSLGLMLSEPWIRQLDALGPMPVTWGRDDFSDFRLDSNTLLQVTERRHADFVLTIRRADAVLGTLRRAIDVLAPDSWVAGSPLDEHAIDLAAFVQPQEPRLRPILDKAAGLLRSRKGDGGLSGYQGTPDYVDSMVQSIWEAAQSERIVYSDPPNSWGLIDSPGQQGQRVRVPGQVLSERVGTCLDTTLLMSSLLAAVGLYPLILISHSHAFVGYWRDDHWREHPRFWALADGRNWVDEGRIVPIETTLLTHPQGTYSAALRLGKDKFVEFSDLTDSWFAAECAAVDVAVTHRSGTIPVPVRVTEADGTVSLVEYKAQELSIDLLDRALAVNASTRAGLQSGDAPKRVKRWMDALLDLSLRNPLLNYRFPSATSVSLMVPDGFLGRLEDMLQVGVKLKLEFNAFVSETGQPVQPLTARRTLTEQARKAATQKLVGEQSLLTTLSPEVFISRMRRMQSAARTIKEESGSNQLYLAMGMVAWVPEGRQVQASAPLILVPVDLRSSNRSREFALEIDVTGQVTPNFSLAERLRSDAKLNLTKLVEPELDDAGVDIDGLVAYVRGEFDRAGLTDYRVDESCTLGFFDFSTYRLWRDLKENWARFEVNSPLVKHLIETPTQAFEQSEVAGSSPDIDDFAASLPVSADGSQAEAVRDALDGKTFVLQGPPGTGKSQTITNLLARALHSGKRVLFVAEKPDALAVVRDRLHAVGLGPFGLNLHDKGMRSADVRAQISEALNASAFADRVGFEAAERNIGRTLAPLQRYPVRLHAPGPFGESAYTARNKLLALGDGPAIRIGTDFLQSATTESLTDTRGRLADVRDAGMSAGTATENVWSFARLSSGDLTQELRERIGRQVHLASEQLRVIRSYGPAKEYLDAVATVDELLSTAPLASRTIHLGVVDAGASQDMDAARRYAVDTIGAFDPSRLFAGAVPQTLVAPVEELRNEARTALASFFIGRKKRVLVVCLKLQQFLDPIAPLNAENLMTKLDEIGKLQKSASLCAMQMQSIPGVSLPPGFNPLDSNTRSLVVQQIRRIDEDIAIAMSDGTPPRARMRTLIAAAPEAARLVGLFACSIAEVLRLTRATPAAVDLWLARRSVSDVLGLSVGGWLSDASERDALQLRRWARLWDVLGPLESRGLADGVRAIITGAISPADADDAFERGVLRASLRRQLDDQGLDAFDGDQQDSLVRGFTAAAAQLRSLSPGVLADDMIGSRGFDAGVTIGAVGELRRELGKQRNAKPVRRLLKDHWHVISRVTPLVLAIPDALVRFVDGDLEPFDLVVFDEASQIRTAHAIGVLGRGRAAVVVGDDKQMPPTSIAQVRAETDETVEEDEADDYEQESILTECAQSRVPQISLTWHYRSEDESLIAFSNNAYYMNQLSSLPAPKPRLDGRGLSFQRVNGRFVRQGRGAGADAGTNVLEAEAIVKEILRRLKDPAAAKFSIGVVTFNRPQQRLIQSLLVATEDPIVLQAIDKEQTPEPVTVWNLETVQGSERDVMLFSVAFSKDEAGKLSRNFGPLNNVGGQRRLNVAVTRARRQVIVYCSFDPEDLNSQGLAEGLQHLERYLRIARDGYELDGALASHRPSPPDRHRDEIVNALRERGLRVGANIGLSEFKVDIAVALAAPEGTWSVGILTDGPAWRARKTVGDRDSLPLSLLIDRMGWPAVARIWMPDWLRDSKGVVDSIEALVRDVEGRNHTPGSGPLVGPPPSVPETTLRPIESADRTVAPTTVGRADLHVSSVPAWRAWSPREFGPSFVLDQLWEPKTTLYLREVVREIIRVEGPVHPDRAARHIGRMHGLERVRNARVADITTAVAPAFVRSQDGFYFLVGDGPDKYSHWFKGGEETRNIDEISLVEISNALRDIARVGLGSSREELVLSGAAALGYQRVSAGIRGRVDLAVDTGLKRGTLRQQNGYIVAGQLG